MFLSDCCPAAICHHSLAAGTSPRQLPGRAEMTPRFAQELSLAAGGSPEVPPHRCDAEVNSSCTQTLRSLWETRWGAFSWQQDTRGSSCHPFTLAQTLLWELAQHLPKAIEARKCSIPSASSSRCLQDCSLRARPLCPPSSSLLSLPCFICITHLLPATFPCAMWQNHSHLNAVSCK